MNADMDAGLLSNGSDLLREVLPVLPQLVFSVLAVEGDIGAETA